jgi:hypothetical protein
MRGALFPNEIQINVVLWWERTTTWTCYHIFRKGFQQGLYEDVSKRHERYAYVFGEERTTVPELFQCLKVSSIVYKATLSSKVWSPLHIFVRKTKKIWLKPHRMCVWSVRVLIKPSWRAWVHTSCAYNKVPCPGRGKFLSKSQNTECQIVFLKIVHEEAYELWLQHRSMCTQ